MAQSSTDPHAALKAAAITSTETYEALAATTREVQDIADRSGRHEGPSTVMDEWVALWDAAQEASERFHAELTAP